MNSTETFPIGTRVRPTTDPNMPGVVIDRGPGWVTVRHDNGESLRWFTLDIEKVTA